MTATCCDLLCVCPHPDDAEIALGGTLRLLADRGRQVWVCDLTRGELATNADTETRWTEAQAAGRVLGLAGRLQLSLPDGFLSGSDREHVLPVVHVLRLLRPAWVVTAPVASRHPDHLAAPALVRRAVFLSRLSSLKTTEPSIRWWPGTLDTAQDAFMNEAWIPSVVADTCPENEKPDLLFDVSATWEAKIRALACYASQLCREQGRRPTVINDPAFLADIDATGIRWGRRAGVGRAEALKLDMRPLCDDLPLGRWV